MLFGLSTMYRKQRDRASEQESLMTEPVTIIAEAEINHRGDVKVISTASALTGLTAAECFMAVRKVVR